MMSSWLSNQYLLLITYLFSLDHKTQFPISKRVTENCKDEFVHHIVSYIRRMYICRLHPNSD